MNSFTVEQIKKMKHTLGLDNSEVMYRNRYITTLPDTDLEPLVEEKLFIRVEHNGMFFYEMNDKGIKVLVGILGPFGITR